MSTKAKKELYDVSGKDKYKYKDFIAIYGWGKSIFSGDARREMDTKTKANIEDVTEYKILRPMRYFRDKKTIEMTGAQARRTHTTKVVGTTGLVLWQLASIPLPVPSPVDVLQSTLGWLSEIGNDSGGGNQAFASSSDFTGEASGDSEQQTSTTVAITTASTIQPLDLSGSEAALEAGVTFESTYQDVSITCAGEFVTATYIAADQGNALFAMQRSATDLGLPEQQAAYSLIAPQERANQFIADVQAQNGGQAIQGEGALAAFQFPTGCDGLTS